jgi:hypothetical protein
MPKSTKSESKVVPKEVKKDSKKSSHKSEEKESKPTKPTKPTQVKKTEKVGSDKGLNQETSKVGLNFNVKPYKAWLKTYYGQHKREVKIMNAHYIMAAMNEVLVFNLLSGSSEMIQKQKTGLLDLSLERFMMYLQRTEHLLTTFSRFHSRYEPGFDYSKQVPLDKKVFAKFVEKKCFHKNDTLNINNDTLNYVFYLVAQANIHCAETAYIFSKYAKKTTVSGDGITAAASVLFSGKMLADILTKIEHIMRILKNKLKKDSDKEPEDKDSDGEDDVESEGEETEGEETDDEDD